MRASSPEQLERWLREPETILADVRAAMGPKRKKGDPLPLWQQKALLDGRARQRAELKRKARERAEASYDAKQAAKRKQPAIWRRFIQAMEPGQWYGIRAVGRSLGVDRGPASRVRQTLMAGKLIERARNPAYEGHRFSPQEIMAGAIQEPEWLYRLTPEGERQRSLIKPILEDPADSIDRGERNAGFD